MAVPKVRVVQKYSLRAVQCLDEICVEWLKGQVCVHVSREKDLRKRGPGGYWRNKSMCMLLSSSRRGIFKTMCLRTDGWQLTGAGNRRRIEWSNLSLTGLDGADQPKPG